MYVAPSCYGGIALLVSWLHANSKHHDKHCMMALQAVTGIYGIMMAGNAYLLTRYSLQAADCHQSPCIIGTACPLGSRGRCPSVSELHLFQPHGSLKSATNQSAQRSLCNVAYWQHGNTRITRHISNRLRLAASRRMTIRSKCSPSNAP